MLPVLFALLTFVGSLFRSSEALRLENLALRHQVMVYQQTVHRLRLRPTDRLFWAWLSRLWSDWCEVVVFVQPRTVMAWQRTQIERLVCHTICCSTTTTMHDLVIGLFIHRYEFGRSTRGVIHRSATPSHAL